MIYTAQHSLKPSEIGEDVKWYAMNAFRGGALTLQKKLAAYEIETFVPKEYGAIRVKGNKINYQLQAVIPSLLFIKSTFSHIDALCKATKNIHFRYTKIYGGDKNRPITIPDEEMAQFISFVDGNEEHISYIKEPETFNLKDGEKVRIIEGPFAGREATFVKVANKTNRQIVIEIEGVLGAAVKCKFPRRIVERI